MLTLLLSLLDRLAKLAELREGATRRRFEDHVEPIYRDLRIVYDDYRAILSKVEIQFSDPAIPIESIANELRDQREKNLRLRDELRRYSGSLQNAPKSEITDFVEAAMKLLRMEPTTPDDRMIRVDSPVYKLLREVENRGLSPGDIVDLGVPNWNRQQFLEMVGAYEGTINRAWEHVSRVYYHLRSTSLQ